ncbi:DUF58 domain-containing protein [Marinospirillum alkaliphilum]|uniref:DUF58 domain-containing protein n=1 Tax=Marinospirillum alkaliphilum DSM 21637 TaxID=1122209 RepID=A0A1K1YH88_9GAMM|nr:DUF58 domain-containing protein [Marinospirillum alkaliphilum]SFX60733.1 Protein of unknown function DUF58 [Marinospirillum alkaliphilum DSM 21637]
MTLALQVTLAELQGLQAAARHLQLDQLYRRGHQASSGHAGPRTGRGLEFREIRSYQPGDDLRYLDWKVTARRGEPYTRTFHEEHRRPLMLFVDLASQLQFGQAGSKAVLAARVAGLLGWSALQGKDQVGGWIETDQQRYWQAPVDRPQTYSPWLARLADCTAQLADMQLRPAGQLDAALDAFARRLPRGSLVMLISDFVGWQSAVLLKQLVRRHPVQVLHLTDPLDHTLPADAGPVWLNGQFERVSKHLQQQWSEAFHARQQALRQALGQSGSYLQLDTSSGSNWMEQLFSRQSYPQTTGIFA